MVSDIVLVFFLKHQESPFDSRCTAKTLQHCINNAIKMSQVCGTLQCDLCAVDTSSDPFLTFSPRTRIQFLGLHVHSGESGDHSHDHQEGTPDYINKMLVVISGIYFFYLMETLFSLITYKDSNHQHHHSVRERDAVNAENTDRKGYNQG